VSDTGVQVVYRRGSAVAYFFLILIPAGIAVKVVLGADWFPVLMVMGMGLVMLFVAASREQLVIDTLARTITCTESFFGRELKSELIPFSRVRRLSIGPNYERRNQRGSPAYQSGFRISIFWDAQWGGGAQMLEVFHDEGQARREAEGLARRIGIKVENGKH